VQLLQCLDAVIARLESDAQAALAAKGKTT
jgi:hypothetical protein